MSAALVANLASVGAKALTWKAALDAVPADEEGGERINVKLLGEVIPAIFIGFLLNTVLFARLGEVARVSVLRRKLTARGVDMPVPTAVGTLVTRAAAAPAATLLVVLLGITSLVSIPGWAATCCGCWRRRRSPSHRGRLSRSRCGRATAAARSAAQQEDDTVERWWHLLGLQPERDLRTRMRQGQAIFRRPRLLAWGLFTATVSWVAQMVGIHWALRRLRHRDRDRHRRRWCSWPPTWSACSRSCPATSSSSRARPSPR